MQKRFSISMERVLFISFVAVFVTLIIAQAALMSPSVRTFLAIDSELEGTPLGADEYLYDRGTIVLELMDKNYDYNLKVLVNGDQKARFFEKTVELEVRNGDVIEIDGSSVHGENVVGIAGKSDNVAEEALSVSVKIDSNVKKLIKVKIQEPK